MAMVNKTSLRTEFEALKALTGRVIAEATLLAQLSRLHDALADWETAAIEIAFNGNAATMVEKPPKNNPATQDKGGE